MTNDQPVEFRGDSATVMVFSDRIRISKHGIGGLWQGGAWKGEHEILIERITNVAWRDAGRIREGYLQFVTSGGVDQRDPYHDANAVIFGRRNQPKFEQARALVEERRRALQSGTGNVRVDPADQLAKLAQLRDTGVVTDAEFDAKKAELLARM